MANNQLIINKKMNELESIKIKYEEASKENKAKIKSE